MKLKRFPYKSTPDTKAAAALVMAIEAGSSAATNAVSRISLPPKTKAKVRFTSSARLAEKLRQRRPDLVSRTQTVPLREVVGRNLSRLRNERGLSRHVLAERTTGIGERAIQRIEEAGEDSNPTVRVLEELAKALKVPATALTDPRATLLWEAV